MDLETVERAAVLKDGIVYDVPRPGRHDAAIRFCCEALKLDRIGQHEQGFVTSKGRFVRRRPAAAMALRAGQVSTLRRPAVGALGLTSEDLW